MRFLFFACALLALASIPVRAQDARANAALLKSAPNGCGTGWNQYIVPDSIPLAQCKFKAACDKHDDCYGKCEGLARDPSAPECEYLRCKQGGDLHGNRICETNVRYVRLASAAVERRKQCDASLAAAIRTDNARNPVCQAFAYVYERAVRAFGEGAYRGLEPPPVSLKQSQADYEKEIREFFRRGTKAEFEAFNSNPPSMKRPIKYVSGRGLVNVP